MVATFTARGVTYSARPMARGTQAELAVNGAPVAVVDISIRMGGGPLASPLLGGSEAEANLIYRGLQAAMAELLERP